MQALLSFVTYNRIILHDAYEAPLPWIKVPGQFKGLFDGASINTEDSGYPLRIYTKKLSLKNIINPFVRFAVRKITNNVSLQHIVNKSIENFNNGKHCNHSESAHYFNSSSFASQLYNDTLYFEDYFIRKQGHHEENSFKEDNVKWLAQYVSPTGIQKTLDYYGIPEKAVGDFIGEVVGYLGYALQPLLLCLFVLIFSLVLCCSCCCCCHAKKYSRCPGICSSIFFFIGLGCAFSGFVFFQTASNGVRYTWENLNHIPSVLLSIKSEFFTNLNAFSSFVNQSTFLTLPKISKTLGSALDYNTNKHKVLNNQANISIQKEQKITSRIQKIGELSKTMENAFINYGNGYINNAKKEFIGKVNFDNYYETTSKKANIQALLANFHELSAAINESKRIEKFIHHFKYLKQHIDNNQNIYLNISKEILEKHGLTRDNFYSKLGIPSPIRIKESLGDSYNVFATIKACWIIFGMVFLFIPLVVLTLGYFTHGCCSICIASSSPVFTCCQLPFYLVFIVCCPIAAAFIIDFNAQFISLGDSIFHTAMKQFISQNSYKSDYSYNYYTEKKLETLSFPPVKFGGLTKNLSTETEYQISPINFLKVNPFSSAFDYYSSSSIDLDSLLNWTVNAENLNISLESVAEEMKENIAQKITHLLQPIKHQWQTLFPDSYIGFSSQYDLFTIVSSFGSEQKLLENEITQFNENYQKKTGKNPRKDFSMTIQELSSIFEKSASEMNQLLSEISNDYESFYNEMIETQKIAKISNYEMIIGNQMSILIDNIENFVSAFSIAAKPFIYKFSQKYQIDLLKIPLDIVLYDAPYALSCFSIAGECMLFGLTIMSLILIIRRREMGKPETSYHEIHNNSNSNSQRRNKRNKNNLDNEEEREITSFDSYEYDAVPPIKKQNNEFDIPEVKFVDAGVVEYKAAEQL